MKKRILAILLVLACLLLAACGSTSPRRRNSASSGGQGDYAALRNTPEPSSEATPASAQAYEIHRTATATWKDSIDNPWVQVIVEIENTGGGPLYLDDSSADLETEDGSLFKVVSGMDGYPQVLLPGERGVYYRSTTLDEMPEGDLTVVPHLNAVPATVSDARLSTSDVTVGNGKYGGLKVMGRIENTSGSTIDGMVYVVCICYNSSGECVAVIYDIITEAIPAGEKRGFEATETSLPKGLTPEDVKTIEAFAYQHQFQW